MKKKLDKKTYLMALGLFTLGREHMKQFLFIEKTLNELLGLDPYDTMSNHVADSLWAVEDGAVDIVDALKKEGFIISKDSK